MLIVKCFSITYSTNEVTNIYLSLRQANGFLLCVCVCISLWKGVNINYQDSHGFSAVHHAALNGHR